MSLRARLTLIYTVVLTAVLATFGGGVYVLLDRNLRGRIDAVLAARAGDIARGVRVADVTLIRGLGLSRPGVYVQIVDPAGIVVARSDAMGNEQIPVDPSVVAVGRGEAQSFTRDVTVGSVPLRVRAVPILDQFGAPQGTALIAAPLDDVAKTLHDVRIIMLFAGLAGIGLAAALGWRSARTALRPVQDIAATAEEIRATTDLSRRVASGGEDELGALAGAFNAMLERLESAQQALSRSLATQRRFVDDASHELRTPLTIMRGNLELVARNAGMARAERQSALRDSIEEAERMTRLVDDLLALARVDAGMPLPDEEVALAPLVAEVVDRTRTQARERRVSATVGAEDARVRGSENLVRRLLENLTDNAIKYTEPGGAISVSLVVEGPTSVLTVADDGVGMTPEELAHAFDRFWRSDRSRERPGSGLGLSIARAVAEAHGGTIEAASEPDAGSTFTVQLPLARRAIPQEPSERAAPVAGPLRAGEVVGG